LITVGASPSRHTLARVRVDSVNARGTVLARVCGTLVDVYKHKHEMIAELKVSVQRCIVGKWSDESIETDFVKYFISVQTLSYTINNTSNRGVMLVKKYAKYESNMSREKENS